MASLEELLINFKTLMNQYFPLTTEVNTLLSNHNVSGSAHSDLFNGKVNLANSMKSVSYLVNDVYNYYFEQYDTNVGAGSVSNLSVSNDNELIINGYQTQAWSSVEFTKSDYYKLKLKIKKPTGSYNGCDFNIFIGGPDKFLKFTVGYYGISITSFDGENEVTEANLSSTGYRYTSYVDVEITRQGNNWTVDWNDGSVVQECTLDFSVENKLGFTSFSWNNHSDVLYVKDVMIDSFPNMLHTELTASSYNVDIDSSVTLTCKVTDSLGDPVVNKTVVLYLNGSSLSTSITNDAGVATFSYTCTNDGLEDFTVDNVHCQVNVTYDTGWKNVSFSSGFTNYDNNHAVRYRRIGNVVHLEGIIKNTSAFTPDTTERTMATITDTNCRPPYSQYQLEQGTGANKFLLTVNANGTICIARYGTTAANTQVANGSWLHCYMTWMV